jgi:hypothetical protein
MNPCRQIRRLHNKIAHRRQLIARFQAEIAAFEKELDPRAQGARARSRSTLSTKEKEREVEKPRRRWVDRDAARAAGADRYWAGELGDRYWRAKQLYLAQLSSPHTRFWSRWDALKLGQFLARRSQASLEELRGLLLEAMNPHRPAGQAPRPRPLTRAEQENLNVSYWQHNGQP